LAEARNQKPEPRIAFWLLVSGFWLLQSSFAKKEK